MAVSPTWAAGWCRTHLGAEPVETRFVVSHLSEVVGLRLGGGAEVVLKRRAEANGRAQRCVTAQRLLAEDGFPCPLPLTDAIVEAGVAVHAERLVEGGEVETDDSPAAAARSAALLADHVRRLERLGVDPPLPNPEWVDWHAPPARHDGVAAPDWMGDLRRRVQAKLAGCELAAVVGHVDWEAQNMRWRDGRPLVVHDWDSLASMPEAAIAGTAAGVFASHGAPVLAPLESSAAFLDAYERARGFVFGPHEREVAWAASLWVALHNAYDELLFARPRLSFERLAAQRDDRLARACA